MAGRKPIDVRVPLAVIDSTMPSTIIGELVRFIREGEPFTLEQLLRNLSYIQGHHDAYRIGDIERCMRVVSDSGWLVEVDGSWARPVKEVMVKEAAEKVPRERNLHLDALIEACGGNAYEATVVELTSAAVALAEIRTASPTIRPEDFLIAARLLGTRFRGGGMVTPPAIAKHWSTLRRDVLNERLRGINLDQSTEDGALNKWMLWVREQVAAGRAVQEDWPTKAEMTEWLQSVLTDEPATTPP